MKTSIDNFEINYDYIKNGNKPTMLLIHSFGTNMNIWEPQLKYLTSHYSIVRIDLPGHGNSICPSQGYCLDDLVQCVFNFTQKIDLKKFSIVGISIGATIAYELAKKYPEIVQATVLISSALNMSNTKIWEDRLSLLEQQPLNVIARFFLTKWLSKEGYNNKNYIYLEKIFINNTIDGLKSMMRMFSIGKKIEHTKLLQPALYIVGNEDDNPSQSLAIDIASKISAELKIIDGASHIPNFEKSETLSQLILNFMSNKVSANE